MRDRFYLRTDPQPGETQSIRITIAGIRIPPQIKNHIQLMLDVRNQIKDLFPRATVEVRANFYIPQHIYFIEFGNAEDTVQVLHDCENILQDCLKEAK